MALPKLVAPEYTLVVPSTKKTIKYRPFVVKEEKLLLMAKESSDPKEIIQAMKKIIDDCTFNTTDVDTLATFDIEYIFLQIRAKSVSETAELSLRCNKEDSEGNKCTKKIPITINLADLKIQYNEDHTDRIKITDKIGCKMKYPNLSIVNFIAPDTLEVKESDIYDIIIECVDFIWDGDEVIYAKDIPKSEIKEFMDTMTASQFQGFKTFFDTMPGMVHKIEFVCPECKQKGEYTFRGISDFFI